MAVMQLCTYIHPFFPFAAETVWFGAVAGHFLLMAWFTWRYMMNFALRDVFPTYFIAYVGVIVASVTAPVFGRHAMGEIIFWFGFAAYMVLFALVTARYCSRHKIADPAKPLFCIYAAPMSLSLAGYLASVEEKSLLMIAVMQVLAQFLFFAVLSQMPKLLRLPFIRVMPPLPFLSSSRPLPCGRRSPMCGDSVSSSRRRWTRSRRRRSCWPRSSWRMYSSATCASFTGKSSLPRGAG